MHDVHIWPTDIHIHDTQKSHGGLFFFFPPVFHSRNLHDSKVRQGEHFTQANKTRHYTPHNVLKSYFP